MFTIDIANKNFNDSQKKYINTILKLDDSKTIVLETRWEDIKVKNMKQVSLQENQTIHLEYSALLQDDVSELFINYSYLDDIPTGTILWFAHSDVKLKLISNKNQILTLRCLVAWSLYPGQRVLFDNYEHKVSFLSERDKNNIIWGIQSGINILSLGALKTLEEVQGIKQFLKQHDWTNMKLFARISQKMMENGIDHILEEIDGVVIHHDDWKELSLEESCIDLVKRNWKPVIVTLHEEDLKDEEVFQQHIEYYMSLGVDLLAISEGFLDSLDEPLEHIQRIFSQLEEIETSKRHLPALKKFDDIVDDLFQEDNYIINLIPQIVKDTDAKIVLCYTGHGVTSAKIASLGMEVPLLVFTKNEFSYRYNNLLWGVKAYKISQTGNYEMFKQIGKEMIRIHFKGNIALDDKVLLVGLRENDKENTMQGLINGIELYKFKNI